MFALEFARAAEREPADCERSCRCRRRSRNWSASGSRRFRPRRDRCSSSCRRSSARRRPCSGRRSRNSESRPLVDEAASAGAIAVGNDGRRALHAPLARCGRLLRHVASGRRRALHLQAADLVDDLEQQARHLALATSTPDEEIAAIVERAAEAAAERGAPDAAAILSAEAVRLTPPGRRGGTRFAEHS